MNTRSPAQWAVLKDALDWNDKWVLDAGCGHGDLLLYAKQAGAHVFGIEANPDIALSTRDRGVPVICLDLNEYMECSIGLDHYDAAICFSVLPYVDVGRTLHNLSEIADMAFIEAQLVGDGPGCFTDEDELQDRLLEYWPKVTRIGETRVEIRDAVRAVWKCEHDTEEG